MVKHHVEADFAGQHEDFFVVLGVGLSLRKSAAPEILQPFGWDIFSDLYRMGFNIEAIQKTDIGMV